jgi:hypothetical protein
VIWSFSAVVKMPLRITLFPAISAGLNPLSFILVTHSRTCSGRISTIFIGPNSGRMCLRRQYQYTCRVVTSTW